MCDEGDIYYDNDDFQFYLERYDEFIEGVITYISQRQIIRYDYQLRNKRKSNYRNNALIRSDLNDNLNFFRTIVKYQYTLWSVFAFSSTKFITYIVLHLSSHIPQ